MKIVPISSRQMSSNNNWTRNQSIALAVLPKISSLCSLFGSTWIVIEVLTHQVANTTTSTNTHAATTHSLRYRPKRKHPYHRMLLAMSIYDILESVWNFTSTWPMSATDDPIPAIWSVGNTYTCSTQGFFLTLSVAVPIYNALLGVFYMLVIKYQYTDITLSKYVEPTMHCIAGIWAFGTAITSGIMKLYNNANLWCWIAPYPSNCLDTIRYGSGSENTNPCIRGDNAWLYRWIFYFGPLWLCIFTASKLVLFLFRFWDIPTFGHENLAWVWLCPSFLNRPSRRHGRQFSLLCLFFSNLLSKKVALERSLEFLDSNIATRVLELLSWICILPSFGTEDIC